MIGDADGLIGAIDVVATGKSTITRDLTILASGVEHGQSIVETIRGLPGVEVVHVSDRVFLMHLGGKLAVESRVPVKTRDDLSMAYTPGVARVCQAIADDPDKAFTLTIRKNMVAVVSDGSAILGLGNLGPRAAMPVMEGKAILFKEFAGVDAFPICLDTQDTEEIIRTVKLLAPTFGGVNLEDISAPRCMEIEERLESELDIPVFHDDQHGTAVVVLAALYNSLRIVEKSFESLKVVINGAGSAGVAIAKLLLAVGVKDLIACDRQGALYRGMEGLDPVKQWMADHSNPRNLEGSLSDVIRDADLFIGVSAKDVLSVDDIRSMADKPMVFAMANPDPEIDPDVARPHTAIMATGRSDYPNQINNVLCFPGLFRGLLDVRAREVNLEMKIAAARAIAGIIDPSELVAEYIVPSVFDRRVAAAVARAVAETAIETGVARRSTIPSQIARGETPTLPVG